MVLSIRRMLLLDSGEVVKTMIEQRDQPTLGEIPNGWHIIRTGRALIGDKYWRPHDRVWLPLVWSDKKHDVDVLTKDMPVVIRKGGR